VITPPTITPLLVAELLVEGERWPVYVHVIDHPDARVLVDTGMTELRPEVADMDPRLVPLSEQAFDLAGVDVVVNTHLHLDHCGGNHLFAGRPIYVQRLVPGAVDVDEIAVEVDAGPFECLQLSAAFSRRVVSSRSSA